MFTICITKMKKVEDLLKEIRIYPLLKFNLLAFSDAFSDISKSILVVSNQNCF